ncbi:HNH endonuclease [Haloferax namakaokahaiae]|uniref:HNH endonuclease n=1 Tax=Haloferax namakaokahaiae TaxID=1748331 RepID=A0ABD5ZHG5_9EURY
MGQPRRKRVYERDDYVCQNCGAKGGPRENVTLHAHHIVPKGKGGSDKMSNLKTLCKRCHDAVHYDVQAPTAREYQSKTSSQTKQKKVTNPFENCPICGSNEISHHPSEDKTLQCSDCWSTLASAKSDRFELRVGPRGHHRTVGAFSPGESGLTLLPENWELLSDRDSLKNIDLEELQSHSNRWSRIHHRGIILAGIVSLVCFVAWIFTYTHTLLLLAVVSHLVIQATGRIFTKRKMVREELPITRG